MVHLHHFSFEISSCSHQIAGSTIDAMAKNGETREPIVSAECYKAAAIIVGTLYCILLISDVPFKFASISGLLLLYQIITGGTLLSLFLTRSQLGWREYCGLGTAIGSLLTLGLDQIFRNTAISKFAWLAPILIFPILFRRSTAKSILPATSPTLGHRQLLVLPAALMLMLSAEWFWPLPLAALLIALTIAFEFPKLRKHAIFSSFVLAPIALFSIHVRPKGWWIEDSDFARYEAISRTLGTWGFRDNINAVGTSLNYHWFVYAWSGLIDRIAGSPVWVSNTRVIPVFVGAGIILVIWAIITHVSHDHKTITLALFAIAGFDSIQTWGSGFKLGTISSPSHFYGLFFLLACFLTLILDSKKQSSKTIPLLCLLGFGVVGAKVAHGAIIGGALFVFWLANIFRTKRIDKHYTALTVSTLFAIALSFYFIILGGGSDSTHTTYLGQFSFVDTVTGDFRPYGMEVRWIVGVILLFGLLATQVTGLIVIFMSDKKNKHFIYFHLGALATGLFATIFLSAEYASELFFLHSASSLLVVFVIPKAINLIMHNELKFPRKILAIMSAVGFVAAITANFLPNLNSGSLTAIALRTIPSIVACLPIGFGLLYICFRKVNTNAARISYSFIAEVSALALIGLLAMSLGFYLSNYGKNILREYPESARNFASITAADNQDLLEVANWINSNTKKSEILATNEFCGVVNATCNSDTDWLLQLEKSAKCSRSEHMITNNCNIAAFPLLTAMVHRRFHAADIFFGVNDGGLLQPWRTQRFLDSVNFSNTPNSKTHQKLRESNVRWFLIRLQLSPTRDWENFGNVRFENNSYAVIELE